MKRILSEDPFHPSYPAHRLFSPFHGTERIPCIPAIPFIAVLRFYLNRYFVVALGASVVPLSIPLRMRTAFALAFVSATTP